MAKCSKCGMERKPRTKLYKKWTDYKTGEVKHFCHACWIKGKQKRNHGFTIRSALKQGITDKVYQIKAKAKNIYERELRKKLKQKQGKCTLCGSDKNLQIHHYKPKSLGGKDITENYIVLCSECHKDYHWRSKE